MAKAESIPHAAQAQVPATRRRTLVIGCILFVLAVVLPLFRQTGSRSWQTIWWEDGSIFYDQAKAHGASVLFRGYNGYLQLPSRVLGIVATGVPVRDLPVYFALTSTLIGALAALFVYRYCEGWIASAPGRLALAALVVLMPALGFENTADITDVIWMFLLALPWALVSLRERRRDVAIRGAVSFAAAVSSVLSVFFIPLALGYAIYRKTRESWFVVAAFGLGLVIQFIVISHSQRAAPEPAAIRRITSLSYLFGHPTLTLLLRFTGVRVFIEFVTAGKGVPSDWRYGDTLLILVCVALTVLVLVVVGRGAARAAQGLAATFVFYALLLFAVAAWESGLGASGLRYSVLPVFLLASAIAVLVAYPGPERGRRIAVVGRPLFVAYVVITIVIGFSVTNARSAAPTWQGALTSAYQEHCIGAQPDKLVVIPTEAGIALFNASEQVMLRCGDLK